MNRINNVFGKGDNIYSPGDGIKSLPANGVPTTYSSTITVTQAPTGWNEPSYPAWAVPTTGYGSKCFYKTGCHRHGEE